MSTRPSSSSSSSSSFEERYDRFMEYNRLGVLNIQNGHLPAAYRNLSAAFEIARQEQIAFEQQDDMSSSAASSSTEETFSNVRLQPTPSRREEGPLRLAPWPLLSREEVVRALSMTKTYDLRMHGLTISADALVRRRDDHVDTTRASSSCSFGRDDWTLASAFVVYNIGILYLICGTNDPSNETHPDKARTMFESCMQLILCSLRHDRRVLNRESVNARKRLCPTGNPLVDTLSLMVLTKTSQAYHLMSRFDGAQAYMAHLGDFCQLLQEDGTYAGDRLIDGLLQSHCKRLAVELSAMLKLEALAPAA